MSGMVMGGVLFVLCLIVASVCAAPAGTDSGPVLPLKDGSSVQGLYLSVKDSDKVVEQYLGIPFAKPPVGPLRFTAPQPAEPWQGVRNATHHPNMCLQDPGIIKFLTKFIYVDFTPPDVSEDCLYLNVYTPSQRSSSEKLPVLVWIPGGGLSLGGASLYDASVLAAHGNIVVVVIQYRLGILGFFSTGDEHAKGNWGFLDQIAALQWVQKNIESFGGDPSAVTIGGDSAGGVSSSMLMLSPLAKGLFHRAILQSGTAMLGIYSTKNPMVSGMMVANALECDSNSTELLVQCLKTKTKDELIKASKHKIFLGATVDGEFLTELAEDVLKSRGFENVPVLLGVNNHEFGWLLPLTFAPFGWQIGMTRQDVTAVANKGNPKGASGTNELVIDYYLKEAKTPQEVRNQFTEMMGDFLMVLQVIKVADYYRDAGAPVYMYEFQHPPTIFKHLRPSFVKADHGDENWFVFGACFWNGHLKLKGELTKEEGQLCKTMMSYWSNFVRTGSPNGPGLVNWPLYDADKKYMQLALQQSEGQGLKQDMVDFFTVELPQKIAALPPA